MALEQQRHEGLWTVDEVAEYLVIQPRTVSLWARTRGLPALRIGPPVNGRLRFEPNAVRDWARSFAMEPARGR